jgi:hypothetical protein
LADDDQVSVVRFPDNLVLFFPEPPATTATTKARTRRDGRRRR